MINRVLIANRGEIARRVIRTCRAMGIETVAVYSDADRDAPHVREADAAESIGPAPAIDSYLNSARVIGAARRAGADAVHPGYGFLSENAQFADACERAGLIFIGPPAAVIRRMGSKTGARAMMAAAGVPVVPGETPAAQDVAAVAAAVRAVGLPVLLKAAAGGGGKGMRVVRDEAGLEESVRAAGSEAARAFGDGTLYVERLIDRARHIEVQIFGDTHGHLVHVMERDCTLQRRHQKVIEEAPAPRLSAAVRDRITNAAIAAGRAAGYVNAGTVEFLLEGDGDDAQFYFLEMNTRLQVEHPITEAVTGLDLVRAQILVASGQPLPFTQARVQATGHAVEARIYAEDSRRLLPQAGRLLRYVEPAGEGIRVDSGVAAGQTVTVHYDPLLAKLIAHGATREQAFARLAAALESYEILGLRHNIAFLRRLIAQPEVQQIQAHTRFIESCLEELSSPPAPEVARAAAVMAAFASARDAEPAAPIDAEAPGIDPWDALGPVSW
ncbi:MAG TPA: biotin carboxylase N-terminal domain-containing protein [Vicinamibacterales bacterium]|nr:biotin carboxylase N-terminal domain-containing protein [Vicinamibacterales bacterium]